MIRNILLRLAHRQGRSLLKCRIASAGITFNNGSVTREFSRRPRGQAEDQEDEDLIKVKSNGTERLSSTNISSSDMEFYSQGGDDFEEDEEDDDSMVEPDAEFKRRQEQIQRELDSRTGRVWTDPWEISEEQWMSNQSADELPDWSPDFVSRLSQERVRVHPDGIPTLQAMKNLTLPLPACPHPGLGQAKAYAKFRNKLHFDRVREQVALLAQSRVEKILEFSSWADKQDAVDELYESLEKELRGREQILGSHPKFGDWVESAIEELLDKIQENGPSAHPVVGSDRKAADPLFMDCFNEGEEERIVPSILSPLKPHPKDGPGRMVEEWELAAHKRTKRILLRESTSKIAEILNQNESRRIYVHGRKGVGKTAVLASIVASARKSEQVVLYLPDGDRLRKNGFFITPSTLREGYFDLQDLSQEACSDFLASHSSQLEDIIVDRESMEKYFTESQLGQVTSNESGTISVANLLRNALEKKKHAPMCFSAMVETMVNQSDVPFLMVMDEFNCFYDKGQYFHMAYDERAQEPIPYHRINLFEHALKVMAVSKNDDLGDVEPLKMKRGNILVAVTESHAVPRRITDALTSSLEQQSSTDHSLVLIEVPRFSDAEADAILANYEATGVGNLRLDRGDTVMDDQEVSYLKMVSGSIGQRLLDASVL